MNLLLAAAAASLCLAVVMWIALVLARWLRHRSMVRRGKRRPAAGLALAEYCADGDVDRLGGKLAHLPVDDVIAVAGRALPSLSRIDRAAVGAALASRGMARAIIRRFARSDENRRILYCELLGTIGGEDALSALRAALKDRATNVRIAAGIALVELGQAPPLAQLLTMLGRAARGSSRLVYLLEKLVPGCEAEIVRLVTTPAREPRLRINALQALGLASPLTHRALLLQLGQEPCPEVAVEVARAIGREIGAKAGAVLAAMLFHAAPSVRREAAAAIGTGGFTNAGPALVRLTSGPDPMVAAAAARSLWLLRKTPAHDYQAAGEAA
jgi:HEAT repeat protein